MAKRTSAAKAAKPKTDELAPLEDLNIVKPIGGDRYEMSADMLYIGEANMRHSHVPDKHLLASIQHHGQLNDLIVRTNADEQWYEVVDGGRRFITICSAIRAGALPKDFLIKVRVDNAASKEISVAANLHLAAHPLDVCEAILELAKTAEDEQAIAAHFGQSVVWVQQRAKLASLSDKARQAYRDGRLDLQAAQTMTRLPPGDQDRLCKGKDRIGHNEIVHVLSGRGVDCSVALFNWKKDYPAAKIQHGLFDDMVLLLDRNLFRDFQDAAVGERIKVLVDEGFNVEKIARDDYTSEGKYVTFTGKVTDKNRGSLHMLVKADHSGLAWKFIGPVISRKAAEAIKKKANGHADETAAEPVELKAKDLNHYQQHILNGHMIEKLRAKVATNKMSEQVVQWIVVAAAIGKCSWVGDGRTGVATAHNGTDMVWGRLQKDYPLEFTGVDANADRAELDKMTIDKWDRLPARDRQRLYLMAVAAMLRVPFAAEIEPKKLAKEIGFEGQLIPKEDFFKRYRADQLKDYLVKSGLPQSSGKWPLKPSKAEFVKVAIETAQSKDAWKLGLA